MADRPTGQSSGGPVSPDEVADLARAMENKAGQTVDETIRLIDRLAAKDRAYHKAVRAFLNLLNVLDPTETKDLTSPLDTEELPAGGSDRAKEDVKHESAASPVGSPTSEGGEASSDCAKPGAGISAPQPEGNTMQEIWVVKGGTAIHAEPDVSVDSFQERSFVFKVKKETVYTDQAIRVHLDAKGKPTQFEVVDINDEDDIVVVADPNEQQRGDLEIVRRAIVSDSTTVMLDPSARRQQGDSAVITGHPPRKGRGDTVKLEPDEKRPLRPYQDGQTTSLMKAGDTSTSGKSKPGYFILKKNAAGNYDKVYVISENGRWVRPHGNPNRNLFPEGTCAIDESNGRGCRAGFETGDVKHLPLPEKVRLFNLDCGTWITLETVNLTRSGSHSTENSGVAGIVAPHREFGTAFIFEDGYTDQIVFGDESYQRMRYCHAQGRLAPKEGYPNSLDRVFSTRSRFARKGKLVVALLLFLFLALGSHDWIEHHLSPPEPEAVVKIVTKPTLTADDHIQVLGRSKNDCYIKLFCTSSDPDWKFATRITREGKCLPGEYLNEMRCYVQEVDSGPLRLLTGSARMLWDGNKGLFECTILRPKNWPKTADGGEFKFKVLLEELK